MELGLFMGGVKTGYCDHSLALTLKICKFSLFESGGTQDLISDAASKS